MHIYILHIYVDPPFGGERGRLLNICGKSGTCIQRALIQQNISVNPFFTVQLSQDLTNSVRI